MDVSATVFFPAHPAVTVATMSARIYKVRRRVSWVRRLTGVMFWACSTIRIQFVVNPEDGGRQNEELSHNGAVASRDSAGLAKKEGGERETYRRDEGGNRHDVLNSSVLEHGRRSIG